MLQAWERLRNGCSVFFHKSLCSLSHWPNFNNVVSFFVEYPLSSYHVDTHSDIFLTISCSCISMTLYYIITEWWWHFCVWPLRWKCHKITKILFAFEKATMILFWIFIQVHTQSSTQIPITSLVWCFFILCYYKIHLLQQYLKKLITELINF